MDTTNLSERSDELLRHMRSVGYSDHYVRAIRQEIGWLCANGDRFDSYGEALDARSPEGAAAGTRRAHASRIGICKRFGVDGELPEPGRPPTPLVRRDAYHRLCPGFAEVVDLYRSGAAVRGMAGSTIADGSSLASTFLLAMQGRGRSSLSEVTEEDVLAWSRSRGLTGDAGRRLRRILGSGLGALSAEAARVAELVPTPPAGRRNIDYLRPDELEAIREVLRDEASEGSLRDRAIVTVLFYTGLRASDVAGLRIADVDWEADEIRLTQAKTGAPLVLPLTARVGNAIYDYLEEGRPGSDDPHVFLTQRRPHRPVTTHVVNDAVSSVMDAAGVRVGDGRRRGSHLFRHNVATTIVASGMPTIAASSALGHEDPGSVERYLHADVEHLRECALDVSAFGIGEGAFDV